MRTYNQRTMSQVNYGLDEAEFRRMLEAVGIEVPSGDVRFNIRVDGQLDGGQSVKQTQPATISVWLPADGSTGAESLIYGGVKFHWTEETPAPEISDVDAAAARPADYNRRTFGADEDGSRPKARSGS
jgi:hypothetical protein